jgi:hypothetical protein
MEATAEEVAVNLAKIRAEREARRADIRYCAREARAWARLVEVALWDAAQATDDATLRQRVHDAFQHEVTLLDRMSRLAEASPEMARSGRAYGQRLRDVAARAGEEQAGERE